MNKNTVNISSLVAGILTALVAVFYLICGIKSIFNFDFDAPAKSNIYIVIYTVEVITVSALLGLFGFLIIKKYVNKKYDDSYMLAPAMVVFAFGVIASFLSMCFWGFGNSNAWISIIFNGAGLALVLVAKFAKLENMVKGILTLVAMGIGFIMSIVDLVQTGDIYIAIDIFTMFMFAEFFGYYLFSMIVDGTFKQSSSKE